MWGTRLHEITIRLLLLLTFLVAGISSAQQTTAIVEAVNSVLDDFHDAAAHGDRSRYLSHMIDDAIFMGTDEQERWPKNPDFSDYVNSRFVDGRGWAYEPVERHVQTGERSNVAWFDEVVFSETNGRFRGTGVLVLERGQWKIAHYAMSFLVYNEDWEEVIELTKRTAAQKVLPNN